MITRPSFLPLAAVPSFIQRPAGSGLSLGALIGSLAVGACGGTPVRIADLDLPGMLPGVGIVGKWESVDRSQGGIGNTLEFHADSVVTQVFGAMVDFTYRVEDARLITTFMDASTGELSEDSYGFRISGDTLIQTDEGSGQEIRRMKRVETLKAGVPPIVGTWSYQHSAGGTAFETFTADGNLYLRRPFRTDTLGTYSAYRGDRLRMIVVDSATRRIEITTFRFVIEGAELMLSPARGPQRRYNRAPPRPRALALTVPGPVRGRELLRWGFQAGDTWEYRLTQSTLTRGDPLRSPESGQMMGQSIRTSQLQTLTLEVAVRQVEANGNITVDWTYTRMQMSTELGGTSFDWDSDRPDTSLADTPQSSMIAPLEAMLGRTLTVVMTPLGEMLEVRGGDAMLAAMLEGLDPRIAPMMEEQLGSMFGEERMVSEFMGGVGTLPEAPVGLGDSWTTHSEMSLPMFGGNMTSETRHTVTGFENQSDERVVLILHEGTIELDDSGRGEGLPFTVSLNDASLSGSTTFSLDRGLILSSATKTEQVMTMSMPAAGMRQRMRTESSTVLELVGPVTGRKRGGPIAPEADALMSVTDLAELPRGAEIVATSTYPEDITVWTLANGVRVVLKPTDFQADQVLALGVSPGGTSLASDEDFVSARTAAQAIGMGGVGDFTPLALRQALSGRNVTVVPFFSNWEEGVEGEASSSDLETLLQLIYLRFTAPRADEFSFEGWKRAREQELRDRRPTVGRLFRDAWNRITTQDHLRRRPLTAQMLEETDLERSLAFYEDRFADAGDFAFNFVGSFDLDTIRPLVERYLGALPSTGRQETWRDLGIRIPSGVVDETVYTRIDPGSNTRILFHGPFEYGSLEQRVRVRALAATLQARLREVLATDLGDAYFVTVRYRMGYQPDDRYELSVAFGSDPERTDEIIQRVFVEVERLQTLGPSEEETADVKSRLLDGYEMSIQRNSFWHRELRTSELRGEDPLERILGFPPVVEALSPETIRDAAGTFLDVENYVRLTVRPDPVESLGVGGSGKWLSSREMQERFDAEVSGRFYPARLEGRLRDGRSEYRAAFAAYPTPFRFNSVWGWAEDRFLARDAELTTEGFRRVWTQEFTDGNGTRRFQGTWVRPARGR